MDEYEILPLVIRSRRRSRSLLVGIEVVLGKVDDGVSFDAVYGKVDERG